MTACQPLLNQIAFSAVDLRLTERWFREGLGFLPAGGSRLMASSPLAARVQGLPRSASTIWWLVGRDAGFQLELFQFRRPIARLMPADFRPCDIGYTRMGVAVEDFDATLARLAGLGTRPGPTIGQQSRRRACVRSPDGVYVEVMEDDPLAGLSINSTAPSPTAVRSVTVSTPDLEASVAYFTQVCGKGPENISLHTPEHEALWGLEGARCERAVFRAGSVLLEVVHYLDPPGKPWPTGYRISDQGILNVAFGADNRRDFEAVVERVVASGATPNCRPLHLPLKPKAGVVYVNDRLGFSVEIVWMAPSDKREWGWQPLPIAKRPAPDNQRVSAHTNLTASIDQVWAVLNDQDSMSRWIGFDPVEVTRPGFVDRNGVGSQRSMQGPLGRMIEQVVSVEPRHFLRYRVIEGSPFMFHQGEIRLRPVDSETEVTWTIRFRSRIPFLGKLWRVLLQATLVRMLKNGLKRYVEGKLPHAPTVASSLSS